MANENESGSEKTEQPTGKRLNKARDDGNVPKSMEVNSAAVLITAILVLMYFGENTKSNLAYIMQSIILNSSVVELTTDSVRLYFYEGIKVLILLLLPFCLPIATVAIIVNIAQSGLNFTTKPLEPKFDKLFDLAGALKKMFVDIDTIVKLGKDLLKLSLMGLVGYLAIKDELPNFIPLIDMSIKEIFSYAAATVLKIIIRVTSVIVAIAILDFIYTKWKYTRDLKMTKQEVKEEKKQAENPEIMKMISQRRYEVMQRIMKQDVPKADVVITNPIHVAVAIKYDPDSMTSPKVVGKGLRLIADRIKKIAVENNIPIMENPPLARSLYKKLEIGDEIPEEFYKAIAEVLAFIYKMKQKG